MSGDNIGENRRALRIVIKDVPMTEEFLARKFLKRRSEEDYHKCEKLKVSQAGQSTFRNSTGTVSEEVVEKLCSDVLMFQQPFIIRNLQSQERNRFRTPGVAARKSASYLEGFQDDPQPDIFRNERLRSEMVKKLTPSLPTRIPLSKYMINQNKPRQSQPSLLSLEFVPQKAAPCVFSPTRKSCISKSLKKALIQHSRTARTSFPKKPPPIAFRTQGIDTLSRNRPFCHRSSLVSEIHSPKDIQCTYVPLTKAKRRYSTLSKSRKTISQCNYRKLSTILFS